MGRLSGVTIVIYGAVLSIGLASEFTRYVFAVAALAVFGFLTVGFFLFPKLKAVAPFSLGPSGTSSIKMEKMLMAGTEIRPSDFPQHFTFIFQLRAWPLLAALASFSLAAFCLLISSIPLFSLIRNHEIASLYLSGYLTAIALWISTKWYSEQALLARSRLTLGIITGINKMSSHRQVRYEFRDENDGYFGGIERDFLSKQRDQIVFVMYDQSNPDNNSSSHGFLFRSFKVHPLRQEAQEESGNL
jgi:hypothetical protein